MDTVFFAPENYTDVKLTSTSANHICNLAKEFIRNLELEINNLAFYNEDITIIGSTGTSRITVGNTSVKEIPEMLNRIAEAKSLIAWLREAIKEKENAQTFLNNTYLEMYKIQNNIEDPIRPKKGHILTEIEYYNSLSVKERNRYYELETIASVIGKAIHSDGAYSKARETLFKLINKPTKVQGNGRDTVIYTYTPSISLDEVEKVYFELQNKHREVQSELNSIRHKCELAISASESEVLGKYSKEMEEYRNISDSINNKAAEFLNSESSRISNLKIIIPNSLKNIYEQISKLGK